MENITNEQREFDNLVQQMGEDFQKYSNLFKISTFTNRTLIEFESDSNSMILLSKNNRLLTFFEQSDNDFMVIDADYVESSQEFFHQINAFETFYQAGKDATKRHLISLGMNIESEVSQTVSSLPEPMIEAEPYSQAWLKNSNNATWELHWNNGFAENSEQYISQDLFQIKDGEYLVHEKRMSDNREMLQRHLSVEAVKSFLFDRVSDYENTLAKIGIKVEVADLSSKPTMSLSLQEQLLDQIENEYESFKDGIKQKSKEGMMYTENLYEAMIKGGIVHYISEGYINDEVAGILLESENMLDNIYQAYIEKNSNESFDSIQIAINDYTAQYQGLHQEIQRTFKTPQVFDKTTITPTAFINPTVYEGFGYIQYEFEIDDELRKEWESFGEEINTDVYRIRYDNTKSEIIIMEALSDSFDVSEDKTHLFDVSDVLACCEALTEAGELDDYTPEFITYLENHKEIDQNSQYVGVQEAENMFESFEEFDMTLGT